MHRFLRPFSAALWAVSLFILTQFAAIPEAKAQAPELSSGGMDLHLFRPAVDSKGFLSVNGAEVLARNDFSFGLILDGGFGILPFQGFSNDDEEVAADASRREEVVDRMFTGTFHFNYGVYDHLVLGIQFPVVLASGGVVEVPGVYNEGATDGLSYQGIGDITLHAKYSFLDPDADPVGLAGIAHFQFPSGNDAEFTGEPGVAIWPVIAAEMRPTNWFRFGVNLGYRFNSGDGATFPVDGRTDPTSPTGNATVAGLVDPGNPVTYDDLLTYGAGVSFRVLPTLDIIGELYGTQLVKDFGEASTHSVEALGGLKIFIRKKNFLTLAGGAGFPGNAFQAADWRVVLGFVFEPSIGDRDGDGIKDSVDKCPDDPEDKDGYQDEDGCPEADNDGDGILDQDDECPLIPEDLDGDEDEDGCPDGTDGDRDGDGIPDNVDKCPDDPEDIDEFEDSDGCPDPDNDKDGILDKDDLCPLNPEDFDEFEDKDGCPDPDNDKDRIVDVDDSCPNEPETYNGYKDKDGCPDKGKVLIEGNQIVILEKIYFKTDSAVIQPRSEPILDAVAATLQGNPQIRLVEIQGHADERGSDMYNLRLTKDRAASVLEAVISRGVARERVRSGGYGELCPIDPAHNKAAWEKNRRVEFKIIETSAGPTGVQVICPAGRKYVPK